MSDSFSFVKVVTESTDDLINNLFRAGEIAQWLGYILFLQRMGFQFSVLMTGSSQLFVTPAPGGSAASDYEGHTQAQFIVVKIFFRIRFCFFKENDRICPQDIHNHAELAQWQRTETVS